MRNFVEIRDGRREDAAFIALNVMAAMGFPDISGTNSDEFAEIRAALTEICGHEDTLYSWRRTRVAMFDGERAGSMTAYDGGLYKGLKSLTCKLLGEFNGSMEEMAREFMDNDDEAAAGDFYLDSLAVLPKFRKHGIGTMLMQDAVQIGRNGGFEKVTLIVDKEKPDTKALYERLGFRDFGEIVFFGTCYDRMLLRAQSKK